MVELSCDMISLNTAGLRDNEKRDKVFHYLKQQTSKSVIIFMKETQTVKSNEKIWTSQLAVEVVQLYFPTENLICKMFRLPFVK